MSDIDEIHVAAASVLIVVVIAIRNLQQLLVLFLWLEDRTIGGLTYVCQPIASIMNILTQPNRKTGHVSFYRLALWLVGNLGVLLIAVALSQKSYGILISSAALLFHLLVLLTKTLMLREDDDIFNAWISLDRARFRHMQGAIPPKILLSTIGLVLVDVSILMALVAEGYPGLITGTERHLGYYDCFLFVTLHAPVFGSIPALLGSELPVSVVSDGLAGTCVTVAINTLLFAFISLGVRFELAKANSIVMLVNGLKSDHSEIALLQRRVTRAPSVMKSKILDLILSDPLPRTRRRALSVVYHARIISFPRTFAHNLHHEKKEDLKLHGLHQIQKFLDDVDIHYTSDELKEIKNKLSYQLQRRKGCHGEKTKRKIGELLDKIEAR